MRSPLIFALLGVALAATCLAQSSSRIVGTVRDQSGAILPQAEFEIINLETGARRLVKTNAEGDYVATALPVGLYRIEMQAQGFKRYSRGPIELAAEQTARVDIELETGQLTESVTVAASAPVVNSETSSVGQVIEETQVKQLPLNGRRFMQLAMLAPGALPGRDSTIEQRQGGISVAVNGQPPNQHNWTMDGVDNNAVMFGLAVMVPSTEAIREFRIESSNYSAEYGRSAGGVVNVQIRYGGNRFHGSLFEFHRNENLDSVKYFDVGTPPLVYNQFGGTLGGPVRRNRTFSNISLQSSGGNSWYHALQLKAERRFRNGLSFLVSHTYSKALDDSGGFQNPDVRSGAKARAGYDIRQSFSTAAVYELPFGRGRRFFAAGPRAIDALIREWQATAIVTSRSGLPFSVTAPGDPANAAAGTVYPDVTGKSNGALPVSERTIDRWFDTSAFTAPRPYTFGSAGRNILEGPGMLTVDFGLSRFFTIRENHKLQFRGEIFNVTNRANF